jgi:arginyl-tRNA synthetase
MTSLPDTAAAAGLAGQPIPPEVDLFAQVRQRFDAAVHAAFGAHEKFSQLPPLTLTASTNAKFGDAQCNSAMAFGKVLGMPPRAVAEAIVAKLDLTGVAEAISPAAIAGPGFINITFAREALARGIMRLAQSDLGILPDPSAPRTVVDLCGVNLAKQMHIGHLRSTVIGDAMARVLERVYGAANVVRQNHVGDWGLPIAMVTAELIRQRDHEGLQFSLLKLDDLDRIYKQAKVRCETLDDEINFVKQWGSGPKVLTELEIANEVPAANMAAARDVLLKLQTGDTAVRAVWQVIFDLTMSACLETTSRLNAKLTREHTAGESFYEQHLAPLVDDLVRRGFAKESEGALIMDLKDQGVPEPLLIRKRDGAYLYATTDLAAIAHRTGTIKAKRVVYCVDSRQSLHFKQVFAGAQQAGLSHGAILQHAAFGTILGEDGKPFKSRSGETVRLSDVIDEAVEKAIGEVKRRSPNLELAQQQAIANAVAIAAIRYTDLATERTKDYVFSLERMVSFEGDTGPYLQYALARVNSILRNAREQGFAIGANPSLEHLAERALAQKLLAYPQVVSDVVRTLEPHRLCAWCYELSGAFAQFFEHCPVLKSEESLRASRLWMCELVRRVLADAFDLLGIPTIERM